MVLFVVVEERSPHPMMPPRLFRVAPVQRGERHDAAGVCRAGRDDASSSSSQLQTVVGYGPLKAGVAFLPITIVMLFLASTRRRSSRPGSARGSRWRSGPIVCAVGIALLAGVDRDSSYWLDIFPGVTIFSLGPVAPGRAPDRDRARRRARSQCRHRQRSQQRGRPRGITARRRGAAGIGRAQRRRSTTIPSSFQSGYEQAMWICVGLLVGGGVVSWLLIRNPPRSELVSAEQALS